MISQNSITLQGNLARDPQALNSSGKARTRLVVAVNYGFGDRAKTDYIDITVFGTTAENAAKYLTKGAEVLVEGHLSQNVYDPGNGESKIYNLEVIGDRVQFGRTPHCRSHPAGGSQPDGGSPPTSQRRDGYGSTHRPQGASHADRT
jgi:single-strand DNA-binding protein